MGIILALCSVLLVSGAQLLMRWSMMHLPAISELSLFCDALLQLPPAALGLAVGLLAYALSMLCWFLALQRVAMSKAYPLLSLSYVLVWLVALSLPALNETFSWGKLVGVMLIFSGLLLVCWPAVSEKR
ncbi:4-amino-4-deoxy-L-arabinose-phosphoundecaprenol flippase subunit ArnF [Erwinia psidii]|uniref:Probable 4-amino-4-deoxy-L-arabinose-phosphoundecaprenol flippase subunit ArnF n=1 Tax=Erwinia psidii TaxID=69224 RepID=A0A3N6UXG1_9GAMM|nr:4-amino-4-deoxy-L-arabinose-phosphoundecaprenol flippase subunit ArnF [Erwinia psidii]MCX8957097.1 4-amino-4-deoxy-L-arabinose-phospho-UDP flippase [Erwinia psidii]MCX8961749.1 4-amino-4-deoxy-L-arabinose-phospho-UDP flippase [Erwinia psidii]MCX8965343.1 4-amino-4-deoxy-L-arabinose-phospho-UDP flippase [Erwinia psidii]RQM37525.1 4-amino-4-deoxy-L-arabinose-phospho-UDP flippase [Erwinia psidii]